MTSQQPVDSSTANGLPSTSELDDYGEMIVRELDRAEANLEDGENQPFAGLSAEVMQDVAHLRNRQFDIFRQHVEIESKYKIHGADTFSAIATTMRKKEGATSDLLNRLADFDAQLRCVMDKFEQRDQPPQPPNSKRSAQRQAQQQQQQEQQQEQQQYHQQQEQQQQQEEQYEYQGEGDVSSSGTTT